MHLEYAQGPTERFDAWWQDDGGVWVSCVHCGYMTRSMNPSYTAHVTMEGGSFCCPNCRKAQHIELVGA